MMSLAKITLFTALLLTALSCTTPGRENSCKSSFTRNPAGITSETSCENLLLPTETQESLGIFGKGEIVFSKIADVLEQHKAEIQNILTEVDNVRGAQYEITQAIRTLRHAYTHEGQFLKNISDLDNIAVYASTNIPLYTLILHGFIPGAVSKNVWFRTASRTRDVYTKLFAFISSQLPEFDFSNIHLLTESKDVNYDYFRKTYVLGMNQKSTYFKRKPSEVVIFTGNPKTALEIQDSIYRNINERGGDLGDFHQIFLKFGSGFNPVIVTEETKGNTERAIGAALESVCINSAQDCIAPKFYVVNSAVYDSYLKDLIARISALKQGPPTDPKSDYSPLTFREEFDDILAFREKYAKFLVNKDAIIDPSTKVVSPHVFSFPISMFKEIELKDFFAPILIHFSYSSEEELISIANDPRVREKAMFATIFGHGSSRELWKTRMIFEENSHATAVNQSMFEEESGNFPFGGYGGDASDVSIIIKSKDHGVEIFRQARPVLFSQEAARYFPRGRKIKIPKATVEKAIPKPSDKRALTKLIAESTTIAPTFGGAKELKKFRHPVKTPRPRGLANIRTIGKLNGMKIFDASLDPIRGEEKKDILKFHGPNVLYGENVQEKLPGVVFHPAGIGGEIEAFNRIRGDINPYFGWGYLDFYLGSDKTLENQTANAIWPGIMPMHMSFLELKDAGLLGPDFFHTQEKVRKLIRDFLNNPSQLKKLAKRRALKMTLTKLISQLFESINHHFPKGAFLKNFDESTTGDLGNQVVSFNQSYLNLINEFLNRLTESATQTGPRPALTDINFSKKMTEEPYETGSKFIWKLLTDPDSILIQERLDVAKTDLGIVREIRVDYVDGEAVTTRPRYSHEYLKEDEEEAADVLNEFFRRAPEEFKYLSGGADIIRLQNGTWKIIELNVGPCSGSIDPAVFPIEANVFRSVLFEEKTPLIVELEKVFKQDIEDQIKYVKSYETEREKWLKESTRDISQAEIARWLRNAYLDEWRKNPTGDNANATLEKIKQLMDGITTPTNSMPRLLYLGAKNYLESKVINERLGISP